MSNKSCFLNCPNCGAPITGAKCEYCGTVFNMALSDEKQTGGFGITIDEAVEAFVNFSKAL